MALNWFDEEEEERKPMLTEKVPFSPSGIYSEWQKARGFPATTPTPAPTLKPPEWTGPRPWLPVSDREIKKATQEIIQPAPMLREPVEEQPSSAIKRTATPQERLEEFEAISPTPTPTGILPLTGGAYETREIGGTEYRGPISTLYPTAGALSMGMAGQPQFKFDDEMKSYFDDMIRAVTQPSRTEEDLRARAQGFGLPPGRGYSGRKSALVSLARIERERKNAAANLANTLSSLMIEPTKFNKELFLKGMEYDIRRRSEETASRFATVAEAKLPLEISKELRAAPTTVSGYEGAEHVTKSWNPETRKWETISRGALPISISQEGRLVDSVTGKVLFQGEGSKFKEQLGLEAYKSYYGQLKAIDDPYSGMSGEAKTKAREQAHSLLVDQMKRLGYGDIFTTTTPSLEGFIKAARGQGSRMSEEDLKKAFQQRYGK